MGSNWKSIDNNFPTFLGGENLKEQVRLLHDFLPILIESLKYQLSNLDETNWNAKAKEDFQTDTTAELDEAMDVTDRELANLIRELEEVQAALEAVAARQAELDADVGWLERRQEELQEQADRTEAAAEEAAAELDGIGQILTRNEDGSCTLGREGMTVHLKGTVYLNGQLL